MTVEITVPIGFRWQNYLTAFTSAYVECALWAELDNSGVPLDANYGADHISADTAQEMVLDCIAFIRENAADLAGIDPGRAGHDFWLTRNHHGVGFWDRGLGDLGDRLTKSAHAHGDYGLYVGDDGKLWGQ